MERGTQQGAMKKVVVNYLFTNTLNWILIFLHGRTKWWGTPWARAENFVKKPPLIVNVTYLELNGFNASIWVS